MPTLFCCILNCEIESFNSKKRKIFYRLPQNADRKQMWLNQIGDKIKYGTISNNSRICNAHFATGKPNIDSSHVDHVPTIFPWSSNDEKSMSFKAVEQYEMNIKDLEKKILTKAFLSASSDSKVSPGVSMTTLENCDYSNVVPEAKETMSLSKIKMEDNIDHFHTDNEIINKVDNQGDSFVINPNFLSYLMQSLSHDNSLSKSESNIHNISQVNHSGDVSNSAPLNLSHNYIKDEFTIFQAQSIKTMVHNKNQHVTHNGQNGQKCILAPQTSITMNQNSVVLTEDANCKSCTCTKSSCLKLYCECFASGNQCSTGCSCFNCRNNNNHKEERDKIVSCYLEKDPYVFSSKIDSQQIGKKHTKGCNCLKSSCLKNYCECFENKVFCSNLCRCRLCYNNEDRAQHNHRQDSKVNPGSLTSDSISVVSENSPKTITRKRKKPVVKSTVIYDEVSSNDSEEEVDVNKGQVSTQALIVEQDIRSVNSMDIPPVLPQEDDFTEEELALMVKFREQRSIKIESVTPPFVSFTTQFTPLNLANNSVGNDATIHTSITTSAEDFTSCVDTKLLMSISNSLTESSKSFEDENVMDSQSEINKLPGNDLISFLVTQKVMVPQPTSLSTSYNHVIPINLIQQHQDSTNQVHDIFAATLPLPQSVTNTIQAPLSYALSKTKISTEDYVRRHIEAAERAVQADNMKKDVIGIKKSAQKQKIKSDYIPQKTSLSPTLNGYVLPNNNPHELSRQQSEDYVLVKGCSIPDLIFPFSESANVSSPLEFSGYTPITSFQSKCSPAFTKAVQMMHNSSHKYIESRSSNVPKALTRSLFYNRKWKDKYKALRKSLHNMRIELRSVKVHMRADQSKIRRLESALLHMSNELYK